ASAPNARTEHHPINAAPRAISAHRAPVDVRTGLGSRRHPVPAGSARTRRTGARPLDGSPRFGPSRDPPSAWTRPLRRLVRIAHNALMPDAMEEIRREAERIHESAMLSAQNQFEFSKRWRRADRWLGGCAAALTAMAGAGGLSDLLTSTGAGVVATSFG